MREPDPEYDDTRQMEGGCLGCMLAIILGLMVWFLVVYVLGGGFAR
jgi:hypothetical protein